MGTPTNTIMRYAWLLMPGLALALTAGCCPDDPELKHGDPRPPCRYNPDPDREPWFAAPVVTAPLGRARDGNHRLCR